MSNYIRRRVRLRRQFQSPMSNIRILRPFTLKLLLLLQLLVVTPTQNIYTRSNDRPAVTATVEETTETPTRAERFTQSGDNRTAVPLESLDIKNIDPKSPSRNLGFSKTPKKSSGETRILSTLNRGRPQRNEARLTRTRGYVESNLTSAQSNFSNIDSFNGSLKAAVYREVDGNRPETYTTTDIIKVLENLSTQSKDPRAGDIDITDIFIEEFSDMNKSNISMTTRGDSLLCTGLPKNSSSGKEGPGFLLVNQTDNSVSMKKEVHCLDTNDSTSPTHESHTESWDVLNSDKENPSAEHTRIAHNSTNFTSCVERCGDDTSFPCSCNEKCLVHKNCCEDMVDACPRLYRQAENTFGHLVNAQIRCEPTTVVFMVESCPTNSHEAGVTAESTVPQGSPAFTPSQDPSDMKDKVLTKNALSRLFLNAPVTDYATGINYANASIFHCNQQTDNLTTDQSLNSRGIPWKVQATHTTALLSEKLYTSAETIDPSALSYIPPPGQPASAGSLCYTNETNSCIYEMAAELGVEPIVCDVSVNYYYSIRKTLGFFGGTSAREICVYCLYRDQTNSLADFRLSSYGLKVLMSLSDTPGRVVYAVEEKSGLRGQIVPWLSWTCDVQEDIVDQRANTPCQAIECNDQYYITPERTCGKKVLMEFALQNGFLIHGKMCRIEPDVLADIAYCYLREFLQLEATDTPYRSSKVSQDNLNLSMTIIRMELYAINNTHQRAQQNNYLQDTLPQVMLLFVRQHCSLAQEERGRNGKLPYSKSLSSQMQKTLDSHDINMTWSRNPNSRSIESINITDIPSSIVFTFCFQLFLTGQFSSSVLHCTWYSEFALASLGAIRMNRSVSEIADEKCLKTTVVQYKSDGRKSSFYFSLNFIVVIATALGWR